MLLRYVLSRLMVVVELCCQTTQVDSTVCIFCLRDRSWMPTLKNETQLCPRRLPCRSLIAPLMSTCAAGAWIRRISWRLVMRPAQHPKRRPLRSRIRPNLNWSRIRQSRAWRPAQLTSQNHKQQLQFRVIRLSLISLSADLIANRCRLDVLRRVYLCRLLV